MYLLCSNNFVIQLDLNDMSKDITINCNNKEISVTIDTKSKSFTGIIYPKGLAKNSSCMAEFNYEKSPVIYKLPLRSCNTMSTYLVCKLILIVVFILIILTLNILKITIIVLD